MIYGLHFQIRSIFSIICSHNHSCLCIFKSSNVGFNLENVVMGYIVWVWINKKRFASIIIFFLEPRISLSLYIDWCNNNTSLIIKKYEAMRGIGIEQTALKSEGHPYSNYLARAITPDVELQSNFQQGNVMQMSMLLDLSTRLNHGFFTPINGPY